MTTPGAPRRATDSDSPATDRAEAATDDRASAPTIGVVLLVALATLLAGVLGAGLLGVGPPEPPPQAGFAASADADTGRIELLHRGGDAVDVERLRVRVRVDGEPLAHQPPVPFFAAKGFRAGPTGPFNVAADPRWTPGETASVRVASTNAPALTPGAQVVVELYVGGVRIARVETTA